jgi:hypothetical protein
MHGKSEKRQHAAYHDCRNVRCRLRSISVTFRRAHVYWISDFTVLDDDYILRAGSFSSGHLEARKRQPVLLISWQRSDSEFKLDDPQKH